MASPLETIETVFKFTPDELIENRSGHLSAKQADYLKKHARLTGCYTWLAYIFILGSMLLVFMVAFNGMGDTAQSPALPIIGGTFSVVFLIVLVFAGIGRFRARDVRSGKISIAEGQASHSTKTLRNNIATMYFVTIGNVRFQVHNSAQYEAFNADNTYRVYFIRNPPVHIILSVEKSA